MTFRARSAENDPGLLPRHVLDVVGLVEPREKKDAARLGKFLDDYLAKRIDVKPATKEV